MFRMVSPWGFRVAGALLVAAGLSSIGCVSAEQHRSALADLQRLRMEAWQRGVEAAALRVALERATIENAQLRVPPPATEPSPALVALTARIDDVARRQEAIADEMRAAGVCTPAPGSPSPDRSTHAVGPAPTGRKVTDLLYSRF